MRYVYLAIVLYLGLHLALAVGRERRFWPRLGAGLVLLLFVLRLLLVQ